MLSEVPRASGLAAGRGPAKVVEGTVADTTGQKWLIWYWYGVGSRWLTQPSAVRFWQGAQLWSRLAPSELSILATPCSAQCDAAQRTLGSFAAILADNGQLMTDRRSL